MTRSAIGQKIKELSNQLDVTLFTPSYNGVIPTSEAHNLYPAIKNAMATVAEAEGNLRIFDSESTGKIKMAMSNTGLIMFLRDYMKEFCAKYPRITFEHFGLESLDLLKKGEIDFVIDAPSLFKGLNVDTTDLTTVHSSFVATKEFLKKHKLGNTITKEDLARLPLITLRPSETAEDIGLQVASHIKTVSMDTTYQLVKGGLGIGHFVRELQDGINDPDLVEVTVNGISLPAIQIVCGHNKTLSRPARVFIDGLVEFCKKLTRKR